MPDPRDAADAFGLLADPTRVAILETFAVATADLEVDSDGTMPELSFSEIYDLVEVDSTSQLSYHLEQLDGTYLTHTEAGWRYTFAGEAVVRLLLSEAYAGAPDVEGIHREEQCPYCESVGFRVFVDDLILFRECEHCERLMGGLPVTPAQVRERSEESLLSSSQRRMAAFYWLFREGVCNECGAGIDIAFTDLRDREEIPFGWVISGQCRQCLRSLNGPPQMWFLSHPASVSFHWEHGVDALRIGLAEMTARITGGDWTASRPTADTVAVTYRLEDAHLRLTATEDLEVTDVERVRRGPVDGG